MEKTQNKPGSAVSAARPGWLCKPLRISSGYFKTKSILKNGSFHTVCDECLCPNRQECFSAGVATFLILGSACTRRCGFCAMVCAAGQKPDPAEPERIARVISKMRLKHAVITSPSRDDLADHGSGQYAAVVSAARKFCPGTKIEVLVPDFSGREDCLEDVLSAGPDVFAHNVEIVPRLYGKVRPQFNYERSLGLLRSARAKILRRRSMGAAFYTKSGFMLGLGEKHGEIFGVMDDLRGVGCDILVIGQYLRPSPRCLPVEKYLRPEEFEFYADRARRAGFMSVMSAPFARSSYLADRHLTARAAPAVRS